MCFEQKKVYTNDRPLFVYKVVRWAPYKMVNGKQVYKSQYHPSGRSVSFLDHTGGTELPYIIGLRTVSLKGPGIHAYLQMPTFGSVVTSTYRVLRCEVPIGAYVRFGIDTLHDLRAVAVSELMPMSEVTVTGPNRYNPPEMWT